MKRNINETYTSIELFKFKLISDIITSYAAIKDLASKRKTYKL